MTAIKNNIKGVGTTAQKVMKPSSEVLNQLVLDIQTLVMDNADREECYIVNWNGRSRALYVWAYSDTDNGDNMQSIYLDLDDDAAGKLQSVYDEIEDRYSNESSLSNYPSAS